MKRDSRVWSVEALRPHRFFRGAFFVGREGFFRAGGLTFTFVFGRAFTFAAATFFGLAFPTFAFSFFFLGESVGRGLGIAMLAPASETSRPRSSNVAVNPPFSSPVIVTVSAASAALSPYERA